MVFSDLCSINAQCLDEMCYNCMLMRTHWTQFALHFLFPTLMSPDRPGGLSVQF